MITRIQNTHYRRIGGFDVRIESQEFLGYNGEWEHDYFGIYLGLKKIGSFSGYPTDSDLKKVVDSETSLV